MDTKKTLIAGGGLSAMILARMLKRYRNPHAEIVIVEKEANLGGQYYGFDYNGHGYFDIGMHLYYESCIPQIDELFIDILPQEEWNFLENNQKDVAGVFFNGRLQQGTPYVDLRNYPRDQWTKYVAGLFSAIKNNGDKEYPAGANAYESLVLHFGQEIADDIFVPVFEKLYFTHARDLDNAAIHLTTVNRVALFDESVMTDLMKSDEIRARICYPDQMTLPSYRTSPQRGIYPKQYGMLRVIERLKSILKQEGVQFITSSVISELESENGMVNRATIKNNNGTTTSFTVSEIYWTAGLPSLAGALKIDNSDLVFEKKKTEDVYVNFLFDKKPDMGNLYHFFCFDKGYRSFRVTNFSNYCPRASENRGFPLTIEFWTQPDDPKTENEILQLAKKELYDFGVINDDYTVLFSKVEKKLGLGFPLPSVRNMENLRIIRKRIQERGIHNIISSGIFSEDDVFFIQDVLKDTYKKISAMPR